MGKIARLGGSRGAGRGVVVGMSFVLKLRSSIWTNAVSQMRMKGE